MKIKNTTLVKLKAEEGMILVNKITGYGAKIIYLGVYDSPDNYEEIKEEDYVEPELEVPEPPEEEMEEEMEEEESEI